ncbi:GNAT family N-acetyltransferase [Streptomyces triticagri]|uniref:GNAT family N-acetyltransferase n=1 Tax=Streptomyces triticagri TaxID=2293568 RepID=A0A372M4V5_9ACTN|nr:GNAT family N-acetyltransferase [Streptomyces triticagri]RFU85660.1 GNAT family N-acetyltransferase [Streptomyces triticagri]
MAEPHPAQSAARHTTTQAATADAAEAADVAGAADKTAPRLSPKATQHLAPADSPRIRTATPEDVAAVLDFWRTAAEGTSISDDQDGVRRLVARDPDALILAELDGRLVGTVIAGFDGWRCHLYRLAVHPEQRRRGIGSALLRAAEQRFTALGGRRGDAMVLVANETAHPAWQSAGYRPEEQWRRWTKPLTA